MTAQSPNLFLLSTFGFCFRPTASADSANWEDVLLVNCRQTPDYSCPICLDYPVAARITQCGHVFCLPCLLHYFDTKSNSKPTPAVATAVPCPLCHAPVHHEELRSVEARPLMQYREGDTITLRLLKRHPRGCRVLLCTEDPALSAELPAYNSPAAAYNRLTTIPFADFARRSVSDLEELGERLARAAAFYDNARGGASAAAALAEKQGGTLASLLDPAGPQGKWIRQAMEVVEAERREVLMCVTADAAPDSSPSRPAAAPSATVAEPDTVHVEHIAAYDYFYQEVTGQQIYLNPEQVGDLRRQVKGESPTLPSRCVTRVAVLAKHDQTVALRRKFPCAAHLPLSSEFVICSVAGEEFMPVPEKPTERAAPAAVAQQRAPQKKQMNPDAQPFVPSWKLRAQEQGATEKEESVAHAPMAATERAQRTVHAETSSKGNVEKKKPETGAAAASPEGGISADLLDLVLQGLCTMEQARQMMVTPKPTYADRWEDEPPEVTPAAQWGSPTFADKLRFGRRPEAPAAPADTPKGVIVISKSKKK